MPFFTMKEVAQIAVNNGFPTTDQNNLITCVAICWGESGGNSDSVNNSNSDGSIDRGLWQINSVHDGMRPGENRFDPNVNAKLMMDLSNGGTNWQPWVAYTSGQYEKHIPAATAAIAGKTFTPGVAVKGSGTGSVSPAGFTDLLSDTSGIENFFKGLLDPNTWIRLGQILLGAALIGIGIMIYFKDGITKTAITAAKFTPAGRALT